MTEELARIGITLPNDLLTHIDESIINNGHASKSDAVRDALRRYIQYHEWMNDVKGERIGILLISQMTNRSPSPFQSCSTISTGRIS